MGTRKWLVTAMVLVCIFVVVGCSSNQESNSKNNNEGETTNSGEKTTITFWRFGTQSPHHEYWIGAIDRFNESSKSIKVEMTEVPSDGYGVKLNAAYAGGNPPDIINDNIGALAKRANLGQYVVLDDFYNNWEGKDDMFEVLLQKGTYQEKIYGLPLEPDAWVFAYRKDYFTAAGLDPNTPPKNWVELMDYAKTLTIREGDTVVRAGLDVPTQNSHPFFHTFSRQNDNYIVDENTKEILFDQVSGIETLEYMTRYAKDNMIIPFDMLKPADSPFVHGNAAMAMIRASSLSQMMKEDPAMEDKLGFTSGISNKQTVTWAGTNLLHISDQSEHIEEIYEFFEFVFSTDETWRRYEETGIAVSLKSLSEQYIENSPLLNQAVIDALEITGIANPKVEFLGTILKFEQAGVEEAMYLQKSPEQALKEAAEKVREEINK